jgi:capsular polysaccharide biosynthesis protein
VSEQTLDLKRSVQIVRRHLMAVWILAAVGFLAGGAYAIRTPPLSSSSALVVLPPSANTATQKVIASSESVLEGAIRAVRTAASLEDLRSKVNVQVLASGVLSINAEGKSAAQAEDLANAVAHSYIAYVTTKIGPAGKVQAKLLAAATTATQGSRLIHLLVFAALGSVAGAAIGALGVLAIGRGDRRLRRRDDLASAIGVPVVASLPVSRATDTHQWTLLLESYKPTAVEAWQLGSALRYLRVGGPSTPLPGEGSDYSLTVLSLASDKKALSLGPQLAAFAASQGIRTALIIGPQQNTNVTATLRAACLACRPSKSQPNLLVSVADQGKLDVQPAAMLTVLVAVVDGAAPQVTDLIRTTAMVLGVSAGVATAEELASVAASAAADGRQIEGMIITDPDPDDRTTGRIPKMAPPWSRQQPTRVPSLGTRSRRMSSEDQPVRTRR